MYPITATNNIQMTLMISDNKLQQHRGKGAGDGGDHAVVSFIWKTCWAVESLESRRTTCGNPHSCLWGLNRFWSYRDRWFFISLYTLQILFWMLITLCCIKEEFLNDEPNFWSPVFSVTDLQTSWWPSGNLWSLGKMSIKCLEITLHLPCKLLATGATC